MCNRILHDSIHVSFPALLRLVHLFATGKRVNHGYEYGLSFRPNSHFYGPKKAIKLAKKTNNKDRRKIKRGCETKL